MSAGGKYMIMMMLDNNFDRVYGVSLCDFNSKLNEDNMYNCTKCIGGAYSAKI